MDFATSFAANPAGTIGNAVLNLLRLIGDGIQTFMNLLQTSVDGTWDDWTLGYTYNELLSDGNGPRNKYTQVSNPNENSRKEWQKSLTIDNNVEGFDNDTKIPVIPVDIYNISLGNIAWLDANFLRIDSSIHPDGSGWTILRNFFTLFTHISIYISAGVLVTSLIFHGINLARTSIDNPNARAGHREGLNRFAVATIMLVGSVILMGLCINFNKVFFDITNMTSSDGTVSQELPIRVTVNGVYSFSTNFTGYARYMCNIEDVDRCVQKTLCVVGYLGFVIINVYAVGLMYIRMFVLMGLGIIGPIIAALHGFNLENISPIRYQTWARWYIMWSAVQVVLAIVCRIILEVTTLM